MAKHLDDSWLVCKRHAWTISGRCCVEQVQSIAFSRKRDVLAKEQGVPKHKLVLKRPEGLSRGAGARWKRQLPLTVFAHTNGVHQYIVVGG